MLSVVNDDGTTANGSSLIDEIVREGAKRMPAAALEDEADAYIAELAHEKDERGRRLVVRNDHHQPRKATTVAGAVEVRAPRVNDKRIDEATGERKRFSSAILPPGAASRRRSARCCRCSTCTVCPRATSCPRWSSSSAARQACHRRRSPGSPSSGRPSTGRSASAICPAATTSTCGPTASTCAYACGRRNRACSY